MVTQRRVGLTDTELRDSPVDVNVVTPDPVNVNITSPNPIPVTGPLTDVELRASPVPVNGPLTDTELRAIPVPVSGPLTDTELRAQVVRVAEEDLRTVLRLLLQVLESPLYLNKTYNAIQSLLVSGSTTAVTGTLTGVTTVTGITNIGGWPADVVVPSSLNDVWANALRRILV